MGLHGICGPLSPRSAVKQVLRKPDGGSRGFGFVTFKDEMSVEKCLVMQHQLNGKQVCALHHLAWIV